MVQPVSVEWAKIVRGNRQGCPGDLSTGMFWGNYSGE